MFLPANALAGCCTLPDACCMYFLALTLLLLPPRHPRRATDCASGCRRFGSGTRRQCFQRQIGSSGCRWETACASWMRCSP